MTPGQGRDDGFAWAARARELAEWALGRLVCRTDAWGEYRPEDEVGREYTCRDGAKGTLGSQKTATGKLTLARLVRHFRAQGRSDVVGMHTADADNRSKGGALDIDWHGPTSTAPEINRRAAHGWYEALVARGFRPLLIDSNGQGGFHLRVLLAEPADAARVYRLLGDLTRDHRTFGLPKPPEKFPKQPDVRRCRKGLGNWLRLPGRHHKREFWSRVWDGRKWLDGGAAVDFLLSLPGDSPVLLPDASPAPPPRLPRAQPCYPSGGLSVRIAAYLKRLPNLGEGQGRDDVAYHFAAWLVRDLALDDATALDWLDRWDSGNNPPKGRECLAEIIGNARTYGRNAVGCGLDPAGGVRVERAGRRGHYILRAAVEVS